MLQKATSLLNYVADIRTFEKVSNLWINIIENIRLRNTLILLITYWKRIKYVLINNNNNNNNNEKIRTSK